MKKSRYTDSQIMAILKQAEERLMSEQRKEALEKSAKACSQA